MEMAPVFKRGFSHSQYSGCYRVAIQCITGTLTVTRRSPRGCFALITDYLVICSIVLSSAEQPSQSGVVQLWHSQLDVLKRVMTVSTDGR